MAQTISLSGQLISTNGNLKNLFTLTDSLTTTSSTSLTNNQAIPTGSWTSLDQGSNTDFRLGYFVNTDATASIKLAVNSTASYSAWLQPGDLALISNSGSATLYAQTFRSTGSNAVLQYFVTAQ